MITTKKLAKSFGEKVIFRDANITVKTGSICGLVGINGAGKSTLLRILCGIMRSDEGEVSIDGHPVFENESIKKRIFFLPDDPFYTFTMTGLKLKELYRTFYDFDDVLFGKYTNKFKLELNKPVRNFSKGMKRQLFISAALACNPDYLYLDEAFDGLDPLARLEFKRGLIDLQQQGGTIVIASHSLRELEDICDSFILIDNGVVRAAGGIDDALGNTVKLQLAFDREIAESDIPLPLLSFSRSGRVITLVARGDREEILQKIQALGPLIADEIPMDFEDLFISEVGDGRQE